MHMTYQELYNDYQARVDETTKRIEIVKRKIYNIGTAKLIIFAGVITGLIYCWDYGWKLNFAIAAFGIILFVLLSKYHTKLFNQKDYLKEFLKINQQEINGLNHSYINEDSGDEFIDHSHIYTHDLDVFGKGSLFQYINRSATQLGREKLASWLINHLDNKEAIEKRQNTVKALCNELETRQHFRVTGLLFKGKSADRNEIEAWANSSLFFKNKPSIKILPYAILSCNIILLILAYLNIVSFSLFVIVFTLFIIGSSVFTKQVSKLLSISDNKLAILNTYAKLIEIIENWDIKDQEMDRIKFSIQKCDHNASQAIRELNKKMNALDQRFNIYLSLMLNGLCLWELLQCIKIEKWKEKYASHLIIWLEAIAEVDAYCSLATFEYNHPDYQYPIISDTPFILEGKNLGHPLMNRTKCVLNPINIPTNPYFLIITGANMAGKST